MKKIIGLIFLSLLIKFSSAGNYISGDISYVHISGNSYSITIRAITLDSFLLDSCYIEVHFGNGDSALVPRVNGPSSQCPYPAHDGEDIAPYFKYSEYYITYNFPSSGTYIITATFLKRTNSILNITNAGNTSPTMVAEIVIDPLLGVNNSVNNLNFPLTIFDTINRVYNFNSAAYDSDGDSLFYEIIPASIGYSTPFASNSFKIDSLSGSVIWNTPVISGDYAYDIKISEYRRIGTPARYFIGSTMMEVWSRISEPLSINELTNSPEISLFPNPGTSTLTLEIKDNTNNNLPSNIIITDVLGETVYKQSAPINNHPTIDISQLSKGIYFLEVQTEKGITRKKFAKQ